MTIENQNNSQFVRRVYITSEGGVLLLFEQISVLFTYVADAKLQVEKQMLVPE